MCGLTAIFAYHPGAPPVSQAELVRIRESMQTRGPDGAGLWRSGDGRVGLAHRRLSIVDLSERGGQPMATDDGELRIVFNGEIYNHRQLRSQLEAKGHRFASHSDTEVLLHGYRQWGRDLPRHLRGMYAFALWDGRQAGLFLARDPLGIKPLYLADDGQTLRVASQVKALLAGGAIPHELDPAGQAGFFLWGHLPEPFTLYRRIQALPAGVSLWVGQTGETSRQTFFALTDCLAEAETRQPRRTPAEAQAALREALLDTVRHHLQADVPVGVFLSSGLDSASLAALATEVSGQTLQTLTLGFQEFAGTATDEMPLAEKLSAQIRSRHHRCWIDGANFREDIPRILAAMDQPSIDGVNTWYVCRAARAAGLKVALSGIGGDELLGGYPSFRQIPRLAGLLAPFDRLPAIGRGFRLAAVPLLMRGFSPKYAGLLEYGGTYGGAYLLRRSLFMPWELPALLGKEAAEEGLARLDTRQRLAESINGLDHPFCRVAALEMSWYLRNQLLRDADWASMAHGLELRTPLVDSVLLAKIMPIAASLGKLAMAKAPAVPLPAEMLHRPKTGFSIPVRQWLARQHPAMPERGLRGWAKFVYDSFLP